jgi:hypothetical protein
VSHQGTASRRLLATAVLTVGLLTAAGCGRGGIDVGSPAEMSCALDAEDGSGAVVLMAQAVPTASAVPCVRQVPESWELNEFLAKSGGTRISFTYALHEPDAVTVNLAPTCSLGKAVEVPSDQPGMRRFDLHVEAGSSNKDKRFYLYPGACTSYEFSLTGRHAGEETADVTSALGFVTRDAVDHQVRTESDDRLQLDPRSAR